MKVGFVKNRKLDFRPILLVSKSCIEKRKWFKVVHQVCFKLKFIDVGSIVQKAEINGIDRKPYLLKMLVWLKKVIFENKIPLNRSNNNFIGNDKIVFFITLDFLIL